MSLGLDQITRNKIQYFTGPVKVRALKNETGKQQPRILLRGHNRAGLGGENTPSLASQRLNYINDATATGCAIVTHAPRGDIH